MQCDLQSDACGQCVRASVSCSGYRDTQKLRIQNESQSVARKALKNAPPFDLDSLPLSLDWQARDAFFAYYVTSSKKCWDFLNRYYHPTDSPDHLTLAIEAVSLAYLWHKVNSNAALATAREKYISALRLINKTLKTSKGATKHTILMASLLLDLFEKITESAPRNQSWNSHVNGALTLVRLRGLEQFQDHSDVRVLERLSQNFMISCVASGSPVPEDLNTVRAFVVDRAHLLQDPKWQMFDTMVEYSRLNSEIRQGILSNDEIIGAAMALNKRFQAHEFDMPPSWQYSTTYLDHKSDRVFGLHYDSYPGRSVSQPRNGLRYLRILINECLIEHYLASLKSNKYRALIEEAQDNIEALADDICASVPQYVDCDGPARRWLSTSEESRSPDQSLDPSPDHRPLGAGHPHTPDHQLFCYTLIFPLYVVGRSKTIPHFRTWVIKQLHYISSHFYIRNAEIVAQILEQETDLKPWEVYALIGSYAFGG
jgi:hypothetical protein